MSRNRLLDELDKVAVRYRNLRLWRSLAIAWLLAAVASLGLAAVRSWAGLQFGIALPVLGLALLSLVVVGIWLMRGGQRGYHWIARRIEAAFPELRTSLLAAIELRPELPDGRYGYLQMSVIRTAVRHAQQHSWTRVVSTRNIALAALAHLASFAFFVVVLAVLAATALPPANNGGVTSDVTVASADGESLSIVIEPGNTEVERGSSLLVLARVLGPLPTEATLFTKSADGEPSSYSMAPSLDDPVFAARIPAIDKPLEYYVELGGRTFPVYNVTVFEYPRLERADAKLVFPDYTGMAPRTVQDVRTVSVVEGTQLTIVCHLNKPVARGLLKRDESTSYSLVATPDDPKAWQATITCDQSFRLQLELTDDAGRKNTRPAEFRVQVVPNQPPTIKPLAPARDVEVSALEELDLKAQVSDDIGLVRYGLTYSLAGVEEVEVVAGESAAAREKIDLVRMLRLEELGAEPDQLLAYHFWAEDRGPDGNVRRVQSDMYFAEVRPFEEIFRQGQAPAGGQQQQQQQQGGQQQGQQNAQNAQQLAQLQKDIINATWKLIRREANGALSEKFAPDAEQLQKSQDTALEQAEALAEKVQDAQSVEHAQTVLQAMKQASQHFQTAHQTPTRDTLPPALAAAQAAYQGLLKLRAREHQVVRQQQRQSGQQSSSSQARSAQQRQQMQQLDLKEDENRYETQRTAQANQQQQQQQDREARQVLNRLQELARRQHDLNERLKELQSALEEAKNEQQREDVRRQLQRLQDEQRQILQDTDELKSRMESAENAERMTDARQQLEETREQVRRASDALDEQKVSQAAASGTRAERELDDLRNEFRKQTSGRFNEQLREMRESARELQDSQKKLTDQLNEATTQQQKTKSLREDQSREQIAEKLGDQRNRLSQLDRQMRQTIEDAEATEPRLAERLNDAVRNAQDQKLDRVLEAEQRSLRQGLADDAKQLDQAANRAIDQLRDGIDKAAETVLGDETESLRRARDELRELSRELNQELQRNGRSTNDRERKPDDAREGKPGEGKAGEGKPSDAKPGESKPGEGESGGGKPGESKPGEGKPSEGKPGQGKPGEGKPGERRAGSGKPGEGQRGDDGKPGDEKPGEGESGDSKPGEGKPGEDGSRERKPGEGKPGRGKPGEEQSSEGKPSEREGSQQQRGSQQGRPQQGGQQQGGQQQGGQQQGGKQQGGRQPGERGRAGQPRQLGGEGGEGRGELEGDAPRGDLRSFAPLSGEGREFQEWSDRLRDVEESVEDPELRAEAARIRQRARSIRAESKRHSAEPNWDLVKAQVAEPLAELRDRVTEELLRRSSKQAIVPLDRDPVPPKYSEKTRLYYERLGSGR